ncbi:hypothetical protein BV20DRAFT_966406 [Pilatotrama ljubarskyi]|nr:hypothetical protein BV20DRAFT_966406 [Pilatotrama ljubarskyi]
MPHPSNPVDDTSVRSYNREHGRLAAVSRTFGSCLLLPSGWAEARTSEPDVCLMDYYS